MSLTLSAGLILQLTLKAYKTRFPMIFQMGLDLRGAAAPLKLNTTYTAHIRSLPSSAAYVAGSGGYKAGATSARTLLTDVPILVDKHRHVPLLWDHLNLIKDHKETFEGALADAGYVLGKEEVDSVLTKAARNSSFTNTITETVANSDRDTLAAACEAMNTNHASPFGRIGICSSSFMTSIYGDAEVASRDYYGMLTGASALRVLRNIEGFEAIYEYPDFPTNAATQTFTAATTDLCTATGHGLKTGDKVRVSNSGGGLPTGLSAATTYYVIYVDADTFKLATTDALAVAGTPIDITGAGTGTHSIVGFDNTSCVFFTRESIAVLQGVPQGTSEGLAALGIPPSMKMDVMTEPESGLTQMLVAWQEQGTADLYVSPTAIWGSALGRQSGAADSLTDRGALRVITE